MIIGVLSDTHGLLRQEVLDALAGCDAILHAGDINNQGILLTLGHVAPVYVVRGNNDGDWAEDIPPQLELTLAGKRICMAHKKKDLPDDLSAFDIAVYGHSHRYENAQEGRTILLNPGSCGPRRFNQAITLAMLVIEGGKITVARIDIPHHNTPRMRIGADLKAQIEHAIGDVPKGCPAVEICGQHPPRHGGR